MFSDADMARYRRSFGYRKTRVLMAIFGWMMHIPFVNVGAVMYYGIVDEGVRSTLQPRWGLLTFHFLNDGMRPTLWHTWQQVAHRNGPYEGIWVPRAPRNATDAEAILEYYRRKHDGT